MKVDACVSFIQEFQEKSSTAILLTTIRDQLKSRRELAPKWISRCHYVVPFFCSISTSNGESTQVPLKFYEIRKYLPLYCMDHPS